MTGVGTHDGQAVDIVATYADARELRLAPLIVLEGVESFVPGTGRVDVRRLGAGHSNETFLVERDDVRYVLRRPPRPPLAPRTHDVEREYRVLSALMSSEVPAPRPVVLCTDPDVIGAPFYLMEFVDGVVVRESFPEEWNTPEERRRACAEVAEALATIHAVDWQDSELAQLSPPSGYLERQVGRLRTLWEHNKTRQVPEMDALAEWIVANQPSGPASTLVHGDFKLDNVIFGREAPVSLLAALDWELAAIGDPMADVGLLSASWVDPGETPDPLLGFSGATAAEGCLTRAELLEEYARHSGRSLSDVRWYECLAIWKIAVITEGNFKRFLTGATSDAFLARVRDGVPRIAARALALARAERNHREGASSD